MMGPAHSSKASLRCRSHLDEWEVLSSVAYILVLYVLTTTSVTLVAPVRESSIVFGALLAWWFFAEPHPVRRILGAAAVAAGITLVAVS